MWTPNNIHKTKILKQRTTVQSCFWACWWQEELRDDWGWNTYVEVVDVHFEYSVMLSVLHILYNLTITYSSDQISCLFSITTPYSRQHRPEMSSYHFQNPVFLSWIFSRMLTAAAPPVKSMIPLVGHGASSAWALLRNQVRHVRCNSVRHTD